jgi:hypothetical protein
MNTTTPFEGNFSYYFLIFLGCIIVVIGFYIRDLNHKKETDWHGEFIKFLNTRNIFWVLESDTRLENCDHTEYVLKIVGYNRTTYYWAKLNAEWLKHVKQIEEETR